MKSPKHTSKKKTVLVALSNLSIQTCNFWSLSIQRRIEVLPDVVDEVEGQLDSLEDHDDGNSSEEAERTSQV